MKCPTDTTVDLVMTDRQGIEIDYCPTCRGVWLDRGELDKIIERSTSALPRPASADAGQRHDVSYRRDDSDGYERPDSYDRPKKKKRSGFLGDIFDF